MLFKEIAIRIGIALHIEKNKRKTKKHIAMILIACYIIIRR